MLTISAVEMHALAASVLQSLAIFTGFILAFGVLAGMIFAVLFDAVFVFLEPLLFRLVRKTVCKRCYNYRVCDCTAITCAGFDSAKKRAKRLRIVK